MSDQKVVEPVEQKQVCGFLFGIIAAQVKGEG